MDTEASSSVEVSFTKEDMSPEEYLNSILPDMFDTKLISLIPGLEPKQFECILKIKINNKEESVMWLENFQEKSLTTWRVDHTYKENTAKIIFKKDFHCHHNTMPKRNTTPHEKHVNCPAKLTITVTQPMKRSKDIYNSTHPCTVFLRFVHNHEIDVSAAVKHRTPTEEIKEIFKDLFTKGHSPASALECFKFDLFQKNADEYFKISADGSLCPSQQWVYKLYYKIFKQEYGEPDGDEMITSLQKFIKSYNSDCGDECAIVYKNDNILTIALCTPLMKRVHTLLETSHEVMFIDSSGNMDRHNSRVFILMCASPLGALPLGMFITFSESEESITQGLNVLKSLFPSAAFFGKLSPCVVITDDCTALRNSLKKVFPSSTLFICKFHILQSIMRYLWNSKNKVDASDRTELYEVFKHILISRSFEEMSENFGKLYELCGKYPNIIGYFQHMEKRSAEWALCFRAGFITRGHETNNFSEATFRIFKDKIFLRLKAFSVVQLFHFFSSRLDQYYCVKINDLINERKKIKQTKYSEKKLENLKTIKVTNTIFKVHNAQNDNRYIVDSEIGCCTCPVGLQGAPCKHQFAVAKCFPSTLQEFLGIKEPRIKIKYHKIAYGLDANVPDGWYNGLVNKSVDSISKPNIDNIETSVESDDANTDKLVEQRDVDKNNVIICQNNLKKVFEDMNHRLTGNPEQYCESFNRFIELYEKCKTESAMISALCTFGKYNGCGLPKIGRKKNLQGGKRIGVQPTAVARRKIKIAGRRIMKSGRPPKKSLTSEHGYGQKRKIKSSLPSVPEKRIAAPHSLSYCIENNISLGVMGWQPTSSFTLTL